MSWKEELRKLLPPTKGRVAMKLLKLRVGEGTSYHVRVQGPLRKGTRMAGTGVFEVGGGEGALKQVLEEVRVGSSCCFGKTGGRGDAGITFTEQEVDRMPTEGASAFLLWLQSPPPRYGEGLT